MIKLLSVVGARPNFMKAAPIIHELRRQNSTKNESRQDESGQDELNDHRQIEHILVHTGQHYDDQLSGIFFAELDLPKPDVNLQVGSGSHAVQMAEIMKRLEPVLLEHKPDMVLVFGDVNSTIAAALTAAKLAIPIAHVEAGLRSFDLSMPEEINRKLTDSIADLLFVTEESGVNNLRREGVAAERTFLVGNVMADSLMKHRDAARRSTTLHQLGLSAIDARNGSSSYASYGVLTLHRPSNVDDAETLKGILKAVNTVAKKLPILFPVHPRTRKQIDDFGLSEYLSTSGALTNAGIVPLAPLGYFDFLALNDNARIVLTDSGGVQEETTVLGVPCLTLRENTERPATVDHGSNQIVGVDPDRIVAAADFILQQPKRQFPRPPLWDGKTSSRIVAILREYFDARPPRVH